jgi:salicylate hydroxylase
MIQAAESDIHDASASPFDISIIGSGLTGLQIAVGLAKRNIRVCIYEQASELRNIGAGVAFNAHFEECMNALDPRIAAILPEIAIKSNRPLHYVDASKKEESLNLQGLINTGNDNNKESDNSVLSDTNVPLKDHTWGCHRAHMIDKLVKLLPAGCLRLGKRLDTIERNGDKVVLNFSDGSKVNTDAGMLRFPVQVLFNQT